MRRTPLWWRLPVITLGILILIWLPVEDRSTISVLIFSILICVFGALAVSGALPGSRQAPGEQDAAPRLRKTQFAVLVSWLIAGLAVTAVALLLMAIKTGVHGHGAPDYTSEQMVRNFDDGSALGRRGSGDWPDRILQAEMIFCLVR